MPSRKQDSTARMLWAVMIVVVSGLLIALAVLKGRPAAKGELGCLDGLPGNRIAILVDKSDPFTPAQQDELKRYFEKIQAEFQVNDLVSIFLLNEPDAMNKKPAFVHCVPQMEGNAAYEAVPKIAIKFKREFGDRFVEIVEGALQSAEAKESPLLEMIKRISRSFYFKEEVGKYRKLYVISDMMQHVGGISFHKQPASFESFKETEFGKNVLDDSRLKGASVSLLIIPRQGVPFQRMQEVKKFWIDYLRHQGVQEVEVGGLP